jgi:hypothetical protein
VAGTRCPIIGIQVNVATVAGELRAENPAALPAACQGAN